MDVGGVLALLCTLVASNPLVLRMVPSTVVLVCCSPEVVVSAAVRVFDSRAIVVFVADVGDPCDPRFVCCNTSKGEQVSNCSASQKLVLANYLWLCLCISLSSFYSIPLLLSSSLVGFTVSMLVELYGPGI